MKDKIIKMFEKGSVLAGFATITEDKKPWVRYVAIEVDPSDLSMRFATAVDSRKVKHIQNNPEVHLTCGINDPKEFPAPYLQIQGRARLSTSESDRKQLWKKDIEGYFKGVDDPNYGVIVVEPYRIEYIDFNDTGFDISVWEG